MILFFLASYDTVIATEIDHNPTKEEIEKLIGFTAMQS